jgi:zinc protease
MRRTTQPTARVAACFAFLLGGACAARPPLPAPVLPLVASEDTPFRSQRPALPAADPPALPATEATTLANGLELRVVRRGGLPTVSVSLVSRAAGRLESCSSAEVVQLTARAVIEGGTRWTDGRIVEPPQVHGEGVNYSVHPDHTRFELSVLREALAGAVEVLARTVRYPAFAGGDLEPVLVSEARALQSASDNSSTLLLRLIATGSFGEPLAQRFVPIRVGEIQAARREAIERCYRQSFGPQHSALIAVGDVTLPELRVLAEPLLGSWAQPAIKEVRAQARAESAQGRTDGRVVHWIATGDRPQAKVMILQRAPASSAVQDIMAYELLATLAVGSFRSRSNTQLRHDSGLTYGIQRNIIRGRTLGMLVVEADFETGELTRAIEGLLLLLDRLREEPVSAAELEHAKLLVEAELERRVSSNEALAQYASQLFAEGRSPDWLQSQRAALRAVEPTDLQRVARQYLNPRDIDIGVVGGVSLKNKLSGIGQLDTYEAALE